MILYWISIICHGREVSRPYHAKSFGKFDTTSFQEIILSPGFFRRETASGFYPWCKVDSPRERVAEGLCGWRHGNCFQWRKAHSRTAKCEAFHIATRLFFMFLFLIPFTIRQHCIIYPQEFSTEPKISLTEFHRIFFGTICVSFPFLLKYKVFYEIFLSLRIGKICIYNFII